MSLRQECKGNNMEKHNNSKIFKGWCPNAAEALCNRLSLLGCESSFCEFIVKIQPWSPRMSDRRHSSELRLYSNG